MQVFRTYAGDPANFDQPDVVLVQTPGWGVGNPPLSLAVLSSFVRAHGFRALALDLNIEHYFRRPKSAERRWDLHNAQAFWNVPCEVERYVQERSDLVDSHVRGIVGTGTRLVGFSLYFSCFEMALHYARRIKELDPRITILFGGPAANRAVWGQSSEKNPFVDAIATGEGELILLEAIQRIRNGEPLEGCPGLTLRKGGNAGQRELIRDLDALPYGDFSDFDFKRYRLASTLPIMSSRGCPNKCIYCSEKFFWRTYRGLSPERVVDEIEAHLDRYPFIDCVDFQDSLVNANMKRLERFADLVVARDLKFRWTGQAVIRKEMTYEIFRKLRASGCDWLAFGLETSSPDLMLGIGKLLSRGTDIDRLVEDAHRAGLRCIYNFMFGLPGETEADAKASLEFLFRHREHVGAVNPSAAFCGFPAGTPGAETPEKFGIVPSPDGGKLWTSADGSNDTLVRLRRFETFCDVAFKLGVPNIYPGRKLIERDRLIADHYYSRRDFEQATGYYERWVRAHPGDRDSKTKLETCRRGQS